MMFTFSFLILPIFTPILIFLLQEVYLIHWSLPRTSFGIYPFHEFCFVSKSINYSFIFNLHALFGFGIIFLIHKHEFWIIIFIYLIKLLKLYIFLSIPMLASEMEMFSSLLSR